LSVFDANNGFFISKPNVLLTVGNASNWRQVTSATQLRDVEWATHSCTLAFSVCGQLPSSLSLSLCICVLNCILSFMWLVWHWGNGIGHIKKVKLVLSPVSTWIGDLWRVCHSGIHPGH